MFPEPNKIELLSILPSLNSECGAECEIILPEYCPNILKILQATASASVSSCTKNADRLTVEGKTEYNIIYLSEEDECLKSVTQQAVFSQTLNLNETLECDLTVRILPGACSARALNSRKIHVRNTLFITVNRSCTQEIQEFSDDGHYERKLCCKKAAQLLETAEKALRITDEFETDGKQPTSILRRNVTFRETEQKPLTDKMILKADMILDLLCTDEEGRLIPLHKEIPISQILDIPGLMQEHVCCGEFIPLLLNININENNSEHPTIAYDIEINVRCKTYHEVEITWTEDAFSARKAIECEKESISTERMINIRERGAIKETVEIGTCTELLWTEVFPILKSTLYKQENDRILCEGTWDCRMLIKDAEGAVNAVQREVPFLLEIPADGGSNPIQNDTTLLLTDLSWAITDASHMELRGMYEWNGPIFVRETSETVTEIREKEDLPRKEDTVTLYYAAAGESAWTIAKKNACPYPELMRNNQLEEDILKEDTMLVIVSA
ncbi:MAG: DUF3794 domain-containing protein [Clostridia bacterium]|nr:DUF3794 domain-containing protein [Clostridia bacterium]